QCASRDYAHTRASWARSASASIHWSDGIPKYKGLDFPTRHFARLQCRFARTQSVEIETHSVISSELPGKQANALSVVGTSKSDAVEPSLVASLAVTEWNCR